MAVDAGSADRAGHCPKELKRSIGRWENEGEARDNFLKEAVLFALIIGLSIWPIVHAVQALAARW